MLSIFHDENGREVARLEGERSVADLPVQGSYTVQHVVTADDVRNEAARRMMLMVGARDQRHLEITLSNGAREGLRLLAKGAANWTVQDAERAQRLEIIDGRIEAIRAAANSLEPSPPEDYEDDRHWPAH